APPSSSTPASSRSPSPPSRCCCGHRSSSSWCSGPCPPLSCARSGGGERKASAAWGHAEGSGVAGAPGTRGGESGRRGAGSRALPTFTALWNIGRFHRTLEHRSVSPLFATRLGLHRTVRAERARRPRLARFHRTSCRPSVPTARLAAAGATPLRRLLGPTTALHASRDRSLSRRSTVGRGGSVGRRRALVRKVLRGRTVEVGEAVGQTLPAVRGKKCGEGGVFQSAVKVGCSKVR